MNSTKVGVIWYNLCQYFFSYKSADDLSLADTYKLHCLLRLQCQSQGSFFEEIFRSLINSKKG